MSESKPSDEHQPWYAEGLRFECTGCGDCCTGAPGYIWVNQAEIDALANHMDLASAEFEKKFVRKVGIRRTLHELPGSYDCVLFDAKTRKCTVYDARPRQCRTWPFWKSNLRSEATWAETCEVCPGSGKGKLYQLEHIVEQVRVVSV